MSLKLKKMFNQVNECGDKHCSNIITTKKLSEMKEEHFIEVLRKCLPKKNTPSNKRLKIMKNFKNCSLQHTKGSKYSKVVDKRNKCLKKHCKKNYNQAVSSVKKVLNKKSRKSRKKSFRSRKKSKKKSN